MSQFPIIDGAMLRASRKRMGWSQVELSTRAGVSQSIISRLEAEQEPYDCKLSNLLAISKALMVPIDSLIRPEVRPENTLDSFDLEPTFAGFVQLTSERDYADQQQAAFILEGYLMSLLFRETNELQFADPNIDLHDI